MKYYLPYAAFWVAVVMVIMITFLVGCGAPKESCEFGQWLTDSRCS